MIREQAFLDLVTIPRLLEAVRGALGDDLQLLALDSLETPPDAGRAREWHADFRERIPATVCVNCGLYLQDMTDEVGPLRVIPGSHRWDRQPSEEEQHRPLDGEQTVYIDAGDCVVFDAQLWHTGSSNGSDRPRRAIFAYYGKFWMKRMDAYYESALPEALTSADADPVLRQLFGLESTVASVHGDDYNAPIRAGADFYCRGSRRKRPSSPTPICETAPCSSNRRFARSSASASSRTPSPGPDGTATTPSTGWNGPPSMTSSTYQRRSDWWGRSTYAVAAEIWR